MAETLLTVVALAVGGWIIWNLLRPQFLFIIRIEAGVLRVTKGKLTVAFLDEIADACRQANVADGWIGGVQVGRRESLRFSKSIPPGLRQRLRNIWNAAK